MRSEDERLARDVPDIDVIISGHTHTVLTQPVVVGKTLIVSSGSYAAYLGALTLEHSKQKGATLASYRMKHISADIPDDIRIAAKISTFKDWVHDHYLKPYGYRMDQIIAESDFHLEKRYDIYADPAETGLGNLITDAFRHAVEKAEGKNHETIHLAIQPLGMIRGSFLKGNISVFDAFQVLSLGLGADGVPGYPLLAVYIYGDEMKSLLEVETSIAPFKRDAHLQISGATFTFNPQGMPFERVTSVAVRQADGNYRPLESRRLYRVCMNFYTAAMVDFIRKSSHGLLRIEPKDREGHPVTDMKQMIIDADSTASGIQELKEWDALAAYLKTFPDTDGNGIPNVPGRYRGREGRWR
jgi:2',3'-cyclic-nucleotide 2'-phosphodiesterase (5'-nucleotidase family)